jgi:hypothetical protein
VPNREGLITKGRSFRNWFVEMLPGLPGLTGLVIELTEAEVAVGDQRAHSEFACESERLAVVLRGVLAD